MKRRDKKTAAASDTHIPPTVPAIGNGAHLKRTSSTALSLVYPPSPVPLISSYQVPLVTCITAAVFALTASLYIATAYPSVTGGDSGELIITACNTGVAHPPGYPTYTIIMSAVLRITRFLAAALSLPTPDAAYVINITNSLIGSAAAAFIYLSTTLLTSNSFAGIFSALGFAFTPTVWLYSYQGEVFALNNMFVAALAYVTIKYYESESRYLSYHAVEASNPMVRQRAAAYLSSYVLLFAYIGATLCALCLTNQHTTLFFLIPTLPIITYSLFNAKLLNPLTALNLLLLFIVGLMPYLFLVVQAYKKVEDSWGDQRTLSGFLTHFLRQEYGTFQLAAADVSGVEVPTLSRLILYATVTLKETLYVVPPLAIVGIYTLMTSPTRSVRLSSSLLFYSYIVYILIFHKLANLDLRPLYLGVQARFWQQPNLYLFIFAAVGLHRIIRLIFPVENDQADETTNHIEHDVTEPIKPRHSSSSSPISTGSIVLCSIAIVYIATHINMHYPKLDHSHTNSFYKSGIKIIQSFPLNSIVLLNGDLNNNIIKYTQQCEYIRRDIRLISLQLMTWDWFIPMQAHHYPNVTFPGHRYHVHIPGAFSIKQFLDANIRKFPIFLCGPQKEGDYSNYKTKNGDQRYYIEWPYGICHQFYKENKKPLNLSRFLENGLKGLIRLDELPTFAPTLQHAEDTWEYILYTDAMQRLAFITSFTSFHYNQNMTDRSLLKLSIKLTEEIWAQRPFNETRGTGSPSVTVIGQMNPIETLFRQRRIIGTHDYRSAGVIYGQYSKWMSEVGDIAEHDYASVQMKRVWTEYVDMMGADETEIRTLLKMEVNAYSNRKWPRSVQR